VQVNIIVFVDEKIAHTDHLGPRDLRMACPEWLGYASGGFANDFEAADDSVLTLCIRKKILLALPRTIGNR
jgi:hypothetical protein